MRRAPYKRRPVRWSGTVLVLLVGLLAATLSACQGRPQPSAIPLLAAAEPARTAPAPVRLPEDDAPHQNLTEWWYYTGHLWAEDGRRYGFEFVIFQSMRGDHPVGYLSHFAVTDVARERFRYASRATPRRSAPATLDLDVEGWTLQGGGGRDRLTANMDDYALDLAFVPQKDAALHGGGYISFGPAGDSYYYSRTRLAVTGALRDGEEWLAVSGQGWFDHQWGDYVVAAVGGWDWYSFQFDDGSDLMLYALRDVEGRPGGVFGTYVDPAGNTSDVEPPLAHIEPQGTWTSPHTGATYPSGWHVRLQPPAGQTAPDLSFEVTPLLRDQELAFERLPYWEGAVSVSGTAAGRPLGGEGYVELTVYVP